MQSDVKLTLRADTSAFSTSIRQAEQEFSSRFRHMGSTAQTQSKRIKGNFNSISDGAEKFSTKLKQAAKQLTLMAGAATGIGLLGKRMLDTADSMAKTADRVGVTTDLLQELRFAASQTGVSTVKLETSLERMTKRIGEAATGVGAAATTYQRLGISVTNADGSLRTSEVILNDVANALQSVSSQAEKAAITAALFGREGVALSLLLDKGAKGIEEYRNQAQKLGLVIDEDLLRNSEKAVDQLDILSRIIKSQIVTGFIQLAPSVINFTQRIVASIPAIKDFAAGLLELKDGFIFIAKTIISVKLVSFATGLIDASKAIVTTSGAVTKLGIGFAFLARAIRGIGIGLAIGVVVKSLSLLKQHLDLKRNVKNYISSQQAIIKANLRFSDVVRINIADFRNLSRAEQSSYKERLQSAQQFWQARLNLEARKDSQSNIALEAAKEKRLLAEHLTAVSGILTKRTELEQAHALKLNQIQTSETNRLKSNLKEQLKAFDEANGQLKSLQDKRKNIAKEFQSLINGINSASQKPDNELSVLDIGSAQEDAKAALQSGDIERAFQAVNQAKSIIQSLSKTGNVTKDYLINQATATAEIADSIVQSEIQAQEKNIASIKDKITQIKADSELLKHLTVAFDINGAVQSAKEMRNQIQEQLNNNPLKIPAVVIPEGTNIDKRADAILKPQKKARGGVIHGPGTSTSDSILARLSRGEYVIRASAVKRYGVGLLNKLNHLELPKFATGGLVPPMVPTMSSAPTSSSNVATVNLSLGSNTYAIQTQNVDVVQALTKAVAREALKSGRRI